MFACGLWLPSIEWNEFCLCLRDILFFRVSSCDSIWALVLIIVFKTKPQWNLESHLWVKLDMLLSNSEEQFKENVFCPCLEEHVFVFLKKIGSHSFQWSWHRTSPKIFLHCKLLKGGYFTVYNTEMSWAGPASGIWWWWCMFDLVPQRKQSLCM